MNKINLVLSSVIALYAFDNVNAFQGLEIRKPLNFINKSMNKLNIVNKPLNNTKQIDDNISVKDSINSLKNNLKGTAVSFNKNKIKLNTNTLENNNSFSILSNKAIAQNKTNKIESIVLKNLSKKEEKQATKLIKNWVDNYLSKKNIKLFIANTDKKLEKYNEELKKPHSYNMLVLDKMLIDSTLTDILKDNPHYQLILRNNINYNILISLFALNANKNTEVFNDIAKELDKYNFDLKTFTKIVDIYKKTDIKINEKVKKEKQEKTKSKLVIDNSNSFSIIGNKNEAKNNSYKKFDNLKISKSEYLPKLKKNLEFLNNDEKNTLLDDFSEALAGGDDDLPNNFNVNNKSIGQYLQSSNNLSTDQKLLDIIVSLVNVNMLSYTINLLNPFSSGISLMSMMFQNKPTINSNSTGIVMFSKSYTSVTSYFGQTFDSMFSVIPSIGTIFTSSLLGL